ncbi:MAG: hypothetical protein IJM62_07775, partial [Lachnospiraceae bacterium]|nr:hypothetical protein [Lachnospiraceae bacterium]
RWMLELAVLKGIGPEKLLEYTHPSVMIWDRALSVLKDPEKYDDQEIFDALETLTGKLEPSSVIKKSRDEGVHLFAAVWRYLSENYKEDGRGIFETCFGRRRSFRWYPLGNAVYYEKERHAPGRYVLNDCREYVCKDGAWTENSYLLIYFERKKLEGLIHETDRSLRLYLKTGHPLRKRIEEAWAAPYIEAVIEADRLAKIEAARPKINIRFSDLEQIRRDAIKTRDSLLTEEELKEQEEINASEHRVDENEHAAAIPEHGTLEGTDPGYIVSTEPVAAGHYASTVPEPAVSMQLSGILTTEQEQLLDTLLRGGSVRERIMQMHGMPEIVADELNEALFDELGDTAVICEDGEIILVEDYREDIIRLLGGDI